MSADRDVLVLRPEPEATETARAVARRGWRPVVSPLLAIQPVRTSEPPPFDALIVSSPRAVPHAPPGPAFVVGERTGALWRERGGTVLEGASDGATLAALIRARCPSGRLLHVCGDELAFDFAEALPGVARHVVYRAVPQELSGAARNVLRGGRGTALLTSPRIARLLAEEGGMVRALALSEAVAKAWGGPARVAAAPRMDALLDLLGRAPGDRQP